MTFAVDDIRGFQYIVYNGQLVAVADATGKRLAITVGGTAYSVIAATADGSNVSSVAAEFGNQGQVNYAASKGGIQGLTRCLATEVGSKKRNITVNAVAPGFIETDMTEAVRNAGGEKITSMIPMGRLGKPEDIANAVVFLACEESSYITGQILTVDGGMTLGGF